MFCSELNEIKSIELKLEEIIASSEQFFLQLGHQLNNCRLQAKNIAGMDALVSENVPIEKLTQLGSDLQSLSSGLAARNQSIDFTLQQTKDNFVEHERYGESIENILQELINCINNVN